MMMPETDKLQHRKLSNSIAIAKMSIFNTVIFITFNGILQLSYIHMNIDYQNDNAFRLVDLHKYE